MPSLAHSRSGFYPRQSSPEKQLSRVKKKKYAVYRVDSNLAKVPLAHGISTSRSMNFELGFGVCLNKTKIMLGLPAKLLVERLRSSTEYLIFIFSQT